MPVTKLPNGYSRVTRHTPDVILDASGKVVGFMTDTDDQFIASVNTDPLTGGNKIVAGTSTLTLPAGESSLGGGNYVSAQTYNIIPDTGADLTALIATMLASIPAGSTIVLQPGTYIGDWVFSGRNQLTLVGAGKPMKVANTLAGGTILKGSTGGSPALSTVNAVDSIGIELGYFGVDTTTSAVTVINGIQGGSSNNSNDDINLGLNIHDVTVLGRGFTEAHGFASTGSQHGILVQGGYNVTIERSHSYWFAHGFAIRCSYTWLDKCYAEDAELDSYIWKSDTGSGTVNNCVNNAAGALTAISTDSSKYCANIIVQGLSNGVRTDGLDVASFNSVNSKLSPINANNNSVNTLALTSISVATPAVFNRTAHGQVVGNNISFFTSGTLPTGLNPGVVYKVSTVVDANNFRVSYNGTEVATTAAGSGTHYMSVGIVNNVTINSCTIYGCAADRSIGLNYGTNLSVYGAADSGNTYATGNFFAWAGAITYAYNCNLVGTTDTAALVKQSTGPFNLCVVNGKPINMAAIGSFQARGDIRSFDATITSVGGAALGKGGAGDFGGAVKLFKTAGGINVGYTARWCMETASGTANQAYYQAAFTTLAPGAETNATYTAGKIGFQVDVDSTNGGRISVPNAAGLLTPKARITLPAGIATAGFGPLGFTAGVNLTAPVDGVMEYDGTNLYFTVGSTRKTITMA